MNKYKLIDSVTKIETICDKVTIDGFDYYVSDEKIKELNPDDKYATIVENPRRVVFYTKHIQDTFSKVVICCNNPNIDLPKVVPEFVNFEGAKDLSSFVRGYNKSQETHPFSEEDMIEFAEWKEYNFYQHIHDSLYRVMQARPMYKVLENKPYTTKELLEIWKEQKPKIVYYE